MVLVEKGGGEWHVNAEEILNKILKRGFCKGRRAGKNTRWACQPSGSLTLTKAFMGVFGCFHSGVTHSSLEEIGLTRRWRRISQKCYLASHYTKFDKISLAECFDREYFEAFVTSMVKNQIYDTPGTTALTSCEIVKVSYNNRKTVTSIYNMLL